MDVVIYSFLHYHVKIKHQTSIMSLKTNEIGEKRKKDKKEKNKENQRK